MRRRHAFETCSIRDWRIRLGRGALQYWFLVMVLRLTGDDIVVYAGSTGSNK